MTKLIRKNQLPAKGALDYYNLYILNKGNKIGYSLPQEKPSIREDILDADEDELNLAIDYTNLNKGGSLGYNKSKLEQAQIADDLITDELAQIHKNSRYIGGSKDAARETYLRLHPELVSTINRKSQIYGLKNVLRDRIAKEGYVDNRIKSGNFVYDLSRPANNFSDRVNNYDIIKVFGGSNSNGFESFGLDDAADYILSGKAVLKDNENWSDEYNTNEKQREVHSATGHTVEDSIGIMGATLSYMKNLAKLRNPNMSDTEAENLAGVMYNRGPNHKSILK